MNKNLKKCKHVSLIGTLMLFLFLTYLEPSVLAMNGIEKQPNSTTDINTPVNKYVINLQLNQLTHSVDGFLALGYTNKASTSFDELYFHLYPNAFKKEGGKITVNWVKNEKNKPLDYKIIGKDSTLIEVKLSRRLKPGDKITILMNFRIKVPRLQYRFGRWNGTYNLGNALPIISLYNEEGWNNDPYCRWGETFNSDFSLYRVSLTVPESFSVAATGCTVKMLHHKNATKTVYYETGLVREFALVASKHYKTISDSWKNITINSYYFPEHESRGREALGFAKRAIIDFSEHFGRYPYDEYNVAETYFGGGMEYPNLVMIGTSLYNSGSTALLESVVAHETAHQWWYCLVGNDQCDDPWLDEAFAVYSDVLYHEWKYGPKAGKKHLNLQKFGYILWNGEEVPLGEGILSFGQQTYGPLIYNKGSCVLAMLRSLVGDEKFFTILSTYFNRYKFKLVELEDFIDSAEEVSGIELDWFFDQWLWDTGYTTYSLQDALTWETSEGWKLLMKVTQSNPSFKMPVPTEIILVDNSTKRARVWMGDEQGTFVLDLNLKPSCIIIDPSDDILGAEQYNKKDVEIVSNKQ